jgi:hypothetical protein
MGKTVKIALFDKEFAHLRSYCGYDPPAQIEWDRSGAGGAVSVFTERCFEAGATCRSPIRVAWLLEPEAIHPYGYEDLRTGKLAWATHVLTFDDKAAQRAMGQSIEPVFWSPGGSWIWRRDWQIYPKTRNVSMVAGMKDWTVGHRLRQEVVAAVGDRFDLLCGYGRRPVEPKLEIFKDYRYTVVIENSKVNYYWTDKLIDPLLCGTVPIFWGCPDIGKMFDLGGIITFDTVAELRDILDHLSADDYERRLPAIRANFETAKQFAIVEDAMYREFFFKFDDNHNITGGEDGKHGANGGDDSDEESYHGE